MRRVLGMLCACLASTVAFAQLSAGDPRNIVEQTNGAIKPLEEQLAAVKRATVLSFIKDTMIPMAVGQDSLRTKKCGIEAVWYDSKQHVWTVRAKVLVKYREPEGAPTQPTTRFLTATFGSVSELSTSDFLKYVSIEGANVSGAEGVRTTVELGDRFYDGLFKLSSDPKTGRPMEFEIQGHFESGELSLLRKCTLN